MLLLGDLLRRAAATRPNKIAVIFEETQLTFQELNDKVNRIAHALIDIGVKRGDRVGLLLMNCHDFEIVYFAVCKVGAILVPINFWYKNPEIEYVANKSGISVLILGSNFIETIEAVKERLETVKKCIVVGEEKAEGMLRYSDLLSSHSAAEPMVSIDEQDPHLILYTSGTTGVPKGAVISHRSYFLHTGVSVLHAQVTDNSIYMNVYPMFHMGGPGSMLSSVYMGITVVIISTPPTPKKILEAIQRHKVTHFRAVPTLWARLLEYPEFDNYDLSSLKVAMGASDAMPRELLEEVLRRSPAASPQLYGLTEGGILTYLAPEDSVRKIGSSGKPHCQAEIRLVDEEGKEVPSGQVGEIICRGEHQMSFYWSMPEETKNTIRDGWLYTGDLGRFDEEGYIYIVGRKKDMIISGGQNIYPAEIERVLMKHPKIEEAAVIGISDQEWGESVMAVIVLKKDEKVGEEEIINYVKQNLASYNKPRYVRFVEALPRTAATGKIQKAELKKLYGEEMKQRSRRP
jgi:acyl-CoA synthetase (AMP-forming)/AMP-acid ligase II